MVLIPIGIGGLLAGLAHVLVLRFKFKGRGCMKFLRMKDPVSTMTHLATLLASAVGLGFLLWTAWGHLGHVLVAGVYGCSLLVLYTASTLYHWIKTTARKEALLRKFDHLAINILIAGSATPVLYHGLRGLWRSSMLAAMWILTVAACCVQVFLIKGPRWLYTMLYVLLGCLVLIPVVQLARNLPWQAMALIATGGAVYIAGAVIYAIKKPNLFPGIFGFHEIFHILVSAATVLHFIGIFKYVLP